MTRSRRIILGKFQVAALAAAIVAGDYFVINDHLGMTALLFVLAMVAVIITALIYMVFTQKNPFAAWLIACAFNLLLYLALAVTAMTWVFSGKMHIGGSIAVAMAIGIAVVFYRNEKSYRRPSRRHLKGV